MNLDETVRNLSGKVDKSVVTALVVEHPDERYFIGEAILVGGTTYLLARFVGVYIGTLLGTDAVARKFAEVTKGFLAKLIGKTYTPEDTRQLTHLLEERIKYLEESMKAITDVQQKASAEQAAKKEIADEVISKGALPGQAEKTANQAAAAIEALLAR